MQHGNECSMEVQRPPAVVVARVKVTVATLIVIGADIRTVRSMEMQRRSGSSKSKGNSSNAHSDRSRYRNSKRDNNNRN